MASSSSCGAGVDVSLLNAGQRKGYRLAVEERKTMFITGNAGTGKSTLVKFIIDGLTAKGAVVALTAYNGSAAINIGGTTLCSWMGLGNFEEPLSVYASRKVPNKKWLSTNVLIIDEISVVSAEVLSKLEALARVYRKNDLPFGGMQMILIGDFAQLPPISTKTKKADYCFKSSVWEEYIRDSVVLKEVIRQQDVEFVNILEEVRMGRPSAKTIDTLNSRLITSADYIEQKHGITPTLIFSKKEDVDAENTRQLQKLDGESFFYRATTWNDKTDKGIAAEKFLSTHCQATPLLQFKLGAQVMLVVNLNIAERLVNGSRGIVVDLKKKSVVVQFDDGQLKKIKPYMWSKEKKRRNGTTRLYASYEQIPLILAYAITSHKSQGMTISRLAVNFSKVFECGQTYVCLSRATSLDGLFLLTPFLKSHVKVNKDVIAFYESLMPAAKESESDVDIVIYESPTSSMDEFTPDRTISPYFDGTVESNNVTIPKCFETHVTCMDCSFVFCVECLGNMQDYCTDMECCFSCLHSYSTKRQRIN